MPKHLFGRQWRLCCETVLLVGFCSNASRPTKSAHLLRRRGLDPLRWGRTSLPVSPAYQISQSPLSSCAIPPTQQPLSHQRNPARAALPDHPGNGASGGHRTAQAQWGLPIPDRAAGISEPYKSAPLLAAVRPSGTVWLPQTARSLSDSDAVAPAQSGYSGPGFDCAYCPLAGSSRRQSDTIRGSVGARPTSPSCASRGRLAIVWKGRCIRATPLYSRSPSP